MLQKKSLDIIIPVFNEQECLQELFKRLLVLRGKFLDFDVSVIFVNDGSTDNSHTILNELATKNDYVKLINFSRNFGHQVAITAGLDYSTADFVAIIDADLQDPPELIFDMYQEIIKGNDIVFAKRKTRSGETVFKKWSAKLFYRAISKLCDVSIPLDTGDFRLMKKNIVNELKKMRERHRFIRGMVPWIGFKSASVEYNRDVRFAGNTKFQLKKMINFGKDAIFSFSTFPLRIASLVGYIIVSLGLIGALVMLYIKLYTTLAVPGITAILITIVIIGGIQIIMLGIVGEYIGRIFEEVKGRPLYVISETKNVNKFD